MNKIRPFFSQVHDNYPRNEPEAVLALAVIHRAICDVLYEELKTKPDLRSREEAYRWLDINKQLDAKQRAKHGSFYWWCDLINLSHSYVQSIVKTLIKKNKNIKTRRRIASVT